MASIQHKGRTYYVIYCYRDSNGKQHQRWEPHSSFEEAVQRKGELDVTKNHHKPISKRIKTMSELLDEYVELSAVIVNAFRPAGSAIYGAAAMQSAAKLLRGNTITAMVSFVVLSAGDVADIIQGRISWKQLAKNTSTTAAGVLGGSLGYLGGAAIGTAILPGAGTVVGIIVSVAAGWGASEGADALADLIAEDDAEEMIAIIEQSFASIAEEYFLTQEEVDEAVINLQTLLTADMLKEMYQYSDHDEFARQLIEMSIDPVVAKRTRVELPSEEEYADYVIETLNEIYSDIEGEAVADAQ